jgi:hypothetical protein
VHDTQIVFIEENHVSLVWSSHSFILYWFEMTQSTIQTFNSNNLTIIFFILFSIIHCSIEVLRIIFQYNACHLQMSLTRNGIFYGITNVFVCSIAALLLHFVMFVTLLKSIQRCAFLSLTLVPRFHGYSPRYAKNGPMRRWAGESDKWYNGEILFLQEQLYFADLVVFCLYPLLLTVSPVLCVLDLEANSVISLVSM